MIDSALGDDSLPPKLGVRLGLTTVDVSDGLAVLALLLAAVAGAVGLFVPDLYRDSPEMVRQARATDLVTLTAAAPALGLALWRARRSGSARARMVAIGALGYLAYNYAIYGFSVVINPATPIHLAILGLASWSLVLTVAGIDDATLDRTTRLRLPRRTTSGLLITVAALFAMLWLSQIAGSIISNRLPAAVSDLNLPTSAIYALDIAFALPFLALSGTWLIRHDRRGPASALTALCWLVLMGLSVLSIFGIDAAAGITVDVVPVGIFAVITGAAATLVVGAVISARNAR